MLINHNILHLYGQKLFERAQFTAPLKVQNDLSKEACYLHVIEGEHNQYSGTKLFEANQNRGIFMKCGNFIFEPVAKINSEPTKLIAIHFYPEVLKKLFQDNPPKFLLTQQTDNQEYMAYVDTDEIMSNYMKSVSLLFDHPQLADESILELKLKEIILILSKADSSGVKQILNNLFNPTIVVFKDVIEAHLYSTLSIENLASLTNNSLTTFKRKFKEFYETSPANYIKNKRLEKASKLLKISDSSISDISFECGFNDLAHFSNSFKAKFNVTPSGYRLVQNSKS